MVDTKTIQINPNSSASQLFSDGFAMLTSATEQVNQAALILLDSSDEKDNDASSSLYGAAVLLEIAHEMLFTASERKYVKEQGHEC